MTYTEPNSAADSSRGAAAAGSVPRTLFSTWFSIALLLCAAAIYQFAFASRHQRGVLNSDATLTYAWLRDMVAGDVGFFWMGPPNPFFFPDALLYLPMLLLTRDVGLQFFLYSLAYVLLLVVALAVLTHQLVGRWGVAALYAALSFGALALLPEVLPVYRQQVPTANCHGGALLAGVIYLALALRALLGNAVSWRFRLAAIGFTALASASNLIFPTQFVLPTLATAALLAMFGAIERRPLMRFVIDNLVAALLAAALRAGVQAVGLFWFVSAPLDLSPERIGRSFAVLRDQWLPLIARELGAPGAMLLALWVALSAWIVWRVLTQRRLASGIDPLRARLLFVAVAVNATMLASVLSPVLTAVWANGVSVRYVWPFPLLGFLLLLPLALLAFDDRRRLREGALALTGVAVSVAVVAQALPQVDATALRYPDEPVGRRLVELKRAGQINAGLGEFWSARHLTVMTGHQVQINPVAADLSAEPWLANSFAFFGRESGHPLRYDFVVTNRLDPAALQAAYGPPARVEKIGEHEIHFYDRPIGEDIAAQVCRRMLAAGGDCPLLDSGLELLALMSVGDAGARGVRGVDQRVGLAGTLVFGPYLQLPAGHYEISWRLQGAGADERRFLVFSRWGKNVVQDLRAAPTAAGEVRALFEVRHAERGDLWEFPVINAQPAAGTLVSVQIRRLARPGR